MGRGRDVAAGAGAGGTDAGFGANNDTGVAGIAVPVLPSNLKKLTRSAS